MDSTLHPLKSLLQTQLASDLFAVTHAPYILSALSSEAFEPSSHLPKWSARLNSLLHSKDPGARWAGCCLCLKTAQLSKSTMIESAQAWVNVVLPILSKNEPVPTLKAAVRLLLYVFSSATDVPEFQRQLSTPNILKFTNAMLLLIEKHPVTKLQVFIMDTVAQLITLYPTLHRPIQPAVTSLSLSFLNGCAPTPIKPTLLQSASKLYTVLHLTGGKVQSGNIWRKSLDDTLNIAWSSFLALRSTFPAEGASRSKPLQNQDTASSIPLHLDKLRCCITVICDLIQANSRRPVAVPIGALCDLISALLSCVTGEYAEKYADATVQSMEMSIIPSLWRHGCCLLDMCTRCLGRRFSPRLPQIVSVLTFQLDQRISSSDRLLFLRSCHSILICCHPILPTVLATRLAKALLPSLTLSLEVQETESASSTLGKRSRQKKRTRAFEGDEVFKMKKNVIFSTTYHEEAAIVALDVLRSLLVYPSLPPPIHSLSARVVLSMLIVLQQTPPASLSPNPVFAKRLFEKVQTVMLDVGHGTMAILSKSIGLLLTSTNANSILSAELERKLEPLLHPRLPPLLRAIPHVEALSLMKTELSREEADAQATLNLTNQNAQPAAVPSEALSPTLEPAPSETHKIYTENIKNIAAFEHPETSVGAKPSSDLQGEGITMNIDIPPTLASTTTDIEQMIVSSSTATIPSELPIQMISSHVTTVTAKTFAPPRVTADHESDEDEEEMPLINPDSDTDED